MYSMYHTCDFQVAQSRLAVRNNRPGVEMCRDPPFQRLVAEAGEIQSSISQLNKKVCSKSISRYSG